MTETQISLLTAFVAAKAEFAVVGGQAVIMHGYVRTTHDLDIFIRPTLGNASNVNRALQEFGVPLQGLEAADLLNDEDNCVSVPPMPVEVVREKILFVRRFMSIL